jgi:hypothetical protein
MMRTYAILNALYDLQDGLYGLETKNIADLYELWCFIEVKNQVAAALGVPQKAIKHTNRTEMGNWFGEDPKKGKQSCVVIESEDKTVKLEVLYNAAAVFSGKSGIEHTVAPTGGEQKPDIIMRLVRDYGSCKAFKLTYIFDAKYRLDDEMAINGVGAPPADAINQLHRYRDAIYYGEIKGDNLDDAVIKKEVIGGYILFPGSGNEAEIKESTLYKSIAKVNIGALPLRPGYEVGQKFLCEFIKGLVSKSTEDHLVGTKSQATKGTVNLIDDLPMQMSTIGIHIVTFHYERPKTSKSLESRIKDGGWCPCAVPVGFDGTKIRVLFVGSTLNGKMYRVKIEDADHLKVNQSAVDVIGFPEFADCEFKDPNYAVWKVEPM